MIKIAHRGNTRGPDPEKENSPNYIVDAINQGFDCEIDLWRIQENFFLGHDGPEYKIQKDYLFDFSPNLWIHCKNLEALQFIVDSNHQLNGFWHQSDDFTLTTKGYIWTYPNRPTCSQSILVNLEVWTEESLNQRVAGICSDYVMDTK